MPNYVQKLDGTTTTSGPPPSTSGVLANTTTGNSLVVISIGNGVAATVTGMAVSTGVATFTKIVNSTIVNYYPIEIWLASNIVGGTTPTLTVTYTNPSAAGEFVAYEVAGVLSSDGTPTFTDSTSGAMTVGPVTTTSAVDFIVAGFNCGGTPSVGGWTQYYITSQSDLTEYLITSSAGSYTATGTQSPAIAYTAVIAAFKTPPPPGTPQNQTLHGAIKSSLAVTPNLITPPPTIIRPTLIASISSKFVLGGGKLITTPTFRASIASGVTVMARPINRQTFTSRTTTAMIGANPTIIYRPFLLAGIRSGLVESNLDWSLGPNLKASIVSAFNAVIRLPAAALEKGLQAGSVSRLVVTPRIIMRQTLSAAILSSSTTTLRSAVRSALLASITSGASTNETLYYHATLIAAINTALADSARFALGPKMIANIFSAVGPNVSFYRLIYRPLLTARISSSVSSVTLRFAERTPASANIISQFAATAHIQGFTLEAFLVDSIISHFAANPKYISRPQFHSLVSSTVASVGKIAYRPDFVAHISSGFAPVQRLNIKPRMISLINSTMTDGSHQILRPDLLASITSSLAGAPSEIYRPKHLSAITSGMQDFSRLVARYNLLATIASTSTTGEHNQVPVHPLLLANSLSHLLTNPRLIARPKLIAAIQAVLADTRQLVFRGNLTAVISSKLVASEKSNLRPGMTAQISSSLSVKVRLRDEVIRALIASGLTVNPRLIQEANLIAEIITGAVTHVGTPILRPMLIASIHSGYVVNLTEFYKPGGILHGGGMYAKPIIIII